MSKIIPGINPRLNKTTFPSNKTNFYADEQSNLEIFNNNIDKIKAMLKENPDIDLGSVFSK
jgi:hypothetical protein